MRRPDNVRVAGPVDEDAVFDLLLALELDNSFGIKRDDDRVRQQIQVGTRRQGGIIGVIDAPDGTLIGSIGLVLNNWWYSDSWYLSEIWLFVRPAYRKRLRYYRDLFQFGRWAAAEMQLPLVTSVSSPQRLDAKIRLWRRYSGGTMIGAIFAVTAPGP